MAQCQTFAATVVQKHLLNYDIERHTKCKPKRITNYYGFRCPGQTVKWVWNIHIGEMTFNVLMP